MQAEKIKVLAVTSRKRSPGAPDIPTVAEAGYPALELDSPIGLFGPRGMPMDLRERVANELRAVVEADPVITARIESTGQIVAIGGPDAFAAEIKRLRAKLAGEIAVKSTERLSHLVMADAIGIKVGDRETRDMVDIWALTPDEFNALAYFDPSRGRHDPKNLTDAEALAMARNREATARFCWSPYMHNPKLKARLHRIRLPTLFLWGTADRILSENYGRAYCAAISGARFETIDRAGHFPHIEQPEEFARRVLAFAAAGMQKAPPVRRASGD